MLNESQARAVVKREFADLVIKEVVEFRNLYIFFVQRPEKGEELMDPFYSVDRRTGVFREFPLVDHPDRTEIFDLFDQKQGGN